MENKHIQVIPADVLTQAQTKINEVAALLTHCQQVKGMELSPYQQFDL
jgi:hypothetical protein